MYIHIYYSFINEANYVRMYVYLKPNAMDKQKLCIYATVHVLMWAM